MTTNTTLAIAGKIDMASSGAQHRVSQTRVEIYTDGSSHGNPGPSGWAFVAVLFDATGTPTAFVERSGSVSSISTNNRAELEAALNAVAFVKVYQSAGKWPCCPILILSDSEYVVKGITEWFANWVAKGWRLAKGKAPKNRDLWENLKAATEGLSLGWRWVRGHDGNRWNERADELANSAAEAAARKGVTFRELAE